MNEFIKARLSEPSTYRGLVWIVTAIIGFYKIATGQPVDQLLMMAAAIVGGLGLTKDNQDDGKA